MMRRDCSKLHELGIDAVEKLAAEAPPFKNDEGIEGRIVLLPPYHPWERSRMEFVPTARGRRSEAYLRWKEKYRDDWVVDLRTSDVLAWQEYVYRALRCRELPKVIRLRREMSSSPSSLAGRRRCGYRRR